MIRRAYNSLQSFFQSMFPKYTTNPQTGAQEETELFKRIKANAAQSFLNTASTVAPLDMGTLGAFKQVDTSLKGLSPVTQLVRTQNLAALKAETTRNSILNIVDRDNSFVNQQFTLAMNSSVPKTLSLPTAGPTTGTTVAAPTSGKSVSKTYRRLYNPYPKA